MFPHNNNNNFMNNNNMINNNNFQPFQPQNLPNIQQPMSSINNNMNMLNNDFSNINNPNSNQNKIKDPKHLKLNKIVQIESALPIYNFKYNDKEFDVITQICITAVRDNLDDIANFCSEKIKEKLKGQWFVLVRDKNIENFEYCFSHIKNKDILIFQFREKIFYVSSLNK